MSFSPLLVVPSGLFRSGFPNKILYACLPCFYISRMSNFLCPGEYLTNSANSEAPCYSFFFYPPVAPLA